MPGAHNMPWTDLVDNGRLKDPKTLQQLFTAIGVSAQRPVIASCGSGITAAVVVLALTVLGYPDITLYDGSWSEWGGRADLPVAPYPGVLRITPCSVPFPSPFNPGR